MSHPSKPVVMILAEHYLPGIKGGGPIRTLANLVETLGDEIDFYLLVGDRDCGDSAPYPDIPRNAWIPCGKARVMYLSPAQCTWSHLRRVIESVPYDLLYLNSFWSPSFSLLPMLLHRFGAIRSTPVLLAPRGQFAATALNLKAARKQVVLQLSRWLDLHRGVTWHATCGHEQADIQRITSQVYGEKASTILLAPNLPAPCVDATVLPDRAKEPGSLKLAYLSRVHPIKNLHRILEILPSVNGRIAFAIYGPLEDTAYWESCQALIRQLPPSITVQYGGALAHEQVNPTLAQSHVFILLTQGENFGHVIHEGLMAGCPVIISDTTPWRGLVAAGVGYDLPLDAPERFVAALQQFVDADAATYQAYARRAQAYGLAYAHNEEHIEANRALFRQCQQGAPAS